MNREPFDYTEWRREHLPEEADVRTLSRKAAEYVKRGRDEARFEDLEDLRSAEREVENLRAGRSTTTPLAEVGASVNKRVEEAKHKRPPC